MIVSLQTTQNADGGWPYRPGGPSWTEPTVYALLAGYASGDSTGRSRALDWLRARERSDGGWAPKAGVEESTWVTALAALVPPDDLGTGAHTRAIRWLLGITPANANLNYRVRSWFRSDVIFEPNQGFPWLPDTAAWTTPTTITTLALAKEDRRHPDPALKSRISTARRFLLSHRCYDDGWNHGAIRALEVDAPSYPETTGTALLAFGGSVRPVYAASVAPSIARAEAWWNECPSCEAASWLMLGLRANGRAKDSAPGGLKARTIQDTALRTIAMAGDRGTEIFLA
jgi:hypothetical protein